ncbi:glycoside hydrolase family 3 N-terminal domain-containing protein, partial [Pseudomonas sp. GW456-E6]|uniref:glycoside hydrolase family 3 N-terminal domain-containing protein n=1 Tax=Pseudomonas sp. GW456-E6 TaxID=2070591 RepID=UPI001C456B97
YNNVVQKIAESTRLGIPVTLSTDPRSSLRKGDMLTVASAGDFSIFPDAIGFGAIKDTAIVYEFGKTLAEEYRAVGLSMLLGPMADVATE